MNTNPMDTAKLLSELEKLGFDNKAFKLIHFKPKETIEQHRKYCTKTIGAFKPFGENAIVQRRLQRVLDLHKNGDERSFEKLAENVAGDLPFHKIK